MAKLSLAPHMPNMMANATNPAAMAPPPRVIVIQKVLQIRLSVNR